MASQFADFFTRFYNLALKDHISDPLLHSEWIYFTSMFKNGAVEKERIEMYLGILANQRKRKNQGRENGKANESSNWGVLKDKYARENNKTIERMDHSQTKYKPLLSKPTLDPQMPFDTIELKLQKRYSQPYRHISTDSVISKGDESSKKKQQQFNVAQPYTNMFTLGRKDRAQKHKKMLEASQKLVHLFQSNAIKLR